ncbi:putative selection and upkeep of intraepithelial T-cells protein 1 homolog isoform X4 [Papio anubis]|uniref:putative selection and upkeep of intraepithelial T-cells protein 1 homolog isoform X4 n=1 Tax=Papio anubis TaxID=9555 RepID=UPI0004F23525|nr:putative selection and upkeep of intraepithelial T-cells protein 1 homolog isoform X4 [Papio anubis]
MVFILEPSSCTTESEYYIEKISPFYVAAWVFLCLLPAFPTPRKILGMFHVPLAGLHPGHCKFFLKNHSQPVFLLTTLPPRTVRGKEADDYQFVPELLGIMETAGLSFSRYFVVMNLLQMTIPSSGLTQNVVQLDSYKQFTVNSLERPVLAALGGNVELSCQLSPPQSAEHMEIRWFRSHYTRPVYLYKEGKDLYGETISKYVERTKLLKEAIGEGKVTLRILNVSADDDGQYHCFFKDGDVYEEAIAEVKVTATSLEIQILIHPPNTKGLLVECNSEGWFPQPQMEWRDSRGKIIPPSSKSHSQDGNKLFNMKMSLLLRDSSHGNITCYLRNPVTGQEERTSIVLSDKLFSWDSVWILILVAILAVLLFFIMMPSVELQQREQRRCCDWNSPCLIGIGIVFSSMCVIIGLTITLHHRNRGFFQI